MAIPLWWKSVLAASLALPLAAAAQSNVVTIDASAPIPPPETGFLHLGGRSPSGHDLEVNGRFLTLDGHPWLPVMGEMHFSRVPPDEWETELLKMKAAGIDIVATYIFWIHHEEVEGQFDWTGPRDLRRFVQLCAKHGLYVYLRPGPWDHGEARNGGFPDWLMTNPRVRTNDPGYLAHVARLDSEIARQTHGLLWKDGGPIVGAQLENEYGLHGPGAGSEHILKLKQLALAAGIDVPLFSVTGWPSLDFPPHDVLPVSGGYPDGFWFGDRANLPPSMNYLFNLNRKLGDMGATVPSEDPTGKIDLRHDPYFGAEEAGGMETAYHRRPLMQPDDIAALTLTGIGGGLNLYGYYMFHGGANPPGKLTTLQESTATGYPNDLPVINYDFQAPIGQYGQERESYRKTKLLHIFLNTFGSQLAPMTAAGPDRTPSSPADTTVPRATVRSDGESGFVFVNNFVRQLPMPARPGFQAHVLLRRGSVDVPATPISFPANAYAIFPFNLKLGAATLQSSTAQLLTRIDPSPASGLPLTFVFFAPPGIAPGFAFDPATTATVTAGEVSATRAAGILRLANVTPGPDRPIIVTATSGETIRILLLTQSEAEQCTLATIAGRRTLLLSPAEVFLDENTIHLRSEDPTRLHLAAYPPLTTAFAPSGWATYRFDRSATTIPMQLAKLKDAQPVPPMKMGPYIDWRKTAVPVAPPENEAFAQAAEYRLDLPPESMRGLSNLWLDIDYAGDIARLSRDGKPLDDNFYNGSLWQVGLKRFLTPASPASFILQIRPIPANAPIYLDDAAKSRLSSTTQTATLTSLTVTPEYEVVLDATTGKAIPQ